MSVVEGKAVAVADDLTPAEVQALRRSCRRFVHGRGYRSAADYLAEISAETDLDFYGAGGVSHEPPSPTSGEPRIPVRCPFSPSDLRFWPPFEDKLSLIHI